MKRLLTFLMVTLLASAAFGSKVHLKARYSIAGVYNGTTDVDSVKWTIWAADGDSLGVASSTRGAYIDTFFTSSRVGQHDILTRYYKSGSPVTNEEYSVIDSSSVSKTNLGTLAVTVPGLADSVRDVIGDTLDAVGGNVAINWNDVAGQTSNVNLVNTVVDGVSNAILAVNGLAADTQWTATRTEIYSHPTVAEIYGADSATYAVPAATMGKAMSATGAAAGGITQSQMWDMLDTQTVFTATADLYPVVGSKFVVDAAGTNARTQFVVDTASLGEGSSQGKMLLNRLLILRSQGSNNITIPLAIHSISYTAANCTLTVVDSVPWAFAANDTIQLTGLIAYEMSTQAEAATANATELLGADTTGLRGDPTVGGQIMSGGTGGGMTLAEVWPVIDSVRDSLAAKPNRTELPVISQAGLDSVAGLADGVNLTRINGQITNDPNNRHAKLYLKTLDAENDSGHGFRAVSTSETSPDNWLNPNDSLSGGGCGFFVSSLSSNGMGLFSYGEQGGILGSSGSGNGIYGYSDAFSGNFAGIRGFASAILGNTSGMYLSTNGNGVPIKIGKTGTGRIAGHIDSATSVTLVADKTGYVLATPPPTAGENAFATWNYVGTKGVTVTAINAGIIDSADFAADSRTMFRIAPWEADTANAKWNGNGTKFGAWGGKGAFTGSFPDSTRFSNWQLRKVGTCDSLGAYALTQNIGINWGDIVNKTANTYFPNTVIEEVMLVDSTTTAGGLTIDYEAFRDSVWSANYWHYDSLADSSGMWYHTTLLISDSVALLLSANSNWSDAQRNQVLDMVDSLENALTHDFEWSIPRLQNFPEVAVAASTIGDIVLHKDTTLFSGDTLASGHGTIGASIVAAGQLRDAISDSIGSRASIDSIPRLSHIDSLQAELPRATDLVTSGAIITANGHVVYVDTMAYFNSSGSGLYTHRVYVKDTINNVFVAGARVYSTMGVATFTAETNTYGYADFQVNAGTCVLIASQPPMTFVPKTVILTMARIDTIRGAGTIIGVPSVAGMCRVYGYERIGTDTLKNAIVELELINYNPDSLQYSGTSTNIGIQKTTTNIVGYWYIDAVPSSHYGSDSRYIYRVNHPRIKTVTPHEIIVPSDSATVNVSTLYR